MKSTSTSRYLYRSISDAAERPSVSWPFIALLIFIGLLSGAASAVKVASSRDYANGRLSDELQRQNRHMKSGKWFSLLEEYRGRLESGNVPPELHFLLGRLYYSLGQYDAAVVELEECIEFAPRHKPALFCLGRCYSALKDAVSLEGLLKGDLRPFRDDRNFAYLQGEFHLISGQYIEAVKWFQSSARQKSNLPVMSREALAYYLAGDLEKTESTIHRVLSVEPRVGSAHELLALVYIRQGRLSDALSEFSKISPLGAAGTRARRGKNIIYRVMDGTISEYSLVSYYQAMDTPDTELEQRESLLSEALVANTDFPEAQLELAMVLGRKAANLADAEKSMALKDVERLLEQASKSAFADEQVWFRMGLFLRDQGNGDGAHKCFSTAVSMNSNFIEAHSELSKVCLARTDYDQAFYHACRVIELSPLSSKAYYLAGTALSSMGQGKKGQEYLREAHLLNPYGTSVN